MPDIREVLKGLSPDDRAAYMQARNTMRRAYLAAHAAVLPIDKFEIEDDQFLDLIDIKLAILFDRAGVFDHSNGSVDVEQEKDIQSAVESAATRMMKATQLTQQQAWPMPQNKVN